MEKEISQLEQSALEAIDTASSADELEQVRVNYLGKKSDFTAIMKSLGSLDPAQKRSIGPLANAARSAIQQSVEQKEEELENAFDAQSQWIDVTAPGKTNKRGHLNPLSIVQRDIEDIFTSMGFEIADGPEVETEFFNFDAVNVPDNHPARDMQDTFWIDAPKGEKHVLRTHTSSVQVRYMQQNKPPYRIIIPGRVFRQEATDASHEHTFHQLEALVIGENVSVANFLDIAQSFFSTFFGKEIKVRVRPSYFPFVEPGFEFDISCTLCSGDGCSACQKTGWIEVGGAGMVHQNVLEAGGYEKGEYTGFAWGFGLERLAMMKYKIDDIRHFHAGDTRFSDQF